MDPAQDLTGDQFAPASEGPKRLTTWYAQGHSDGLGDRLLMFDNTSAPSWEILRFKPVLAANPRFETALRQRVERLGSFHHAAFPAVRPITELGHEDGLAVVSTYATGVCLAEGLKKPRSARFAVRLLRQLVPAFAALHQHEPGFAHGAVTIDRLVLTSEGRLMVREHMVGSALASLELSGARLWSDFGILAPVQSTLAGDMLMLDPRSDVTQVALVAISLMVGRRLGPDEYPDKLAELLDYIEDRSIWHEPETFVSLRVWLERALQLRDPGFASAREAQVALADVRDERGRPDVPPRRQLTQRRAAQEAPPSPPPAPPALEPMLRSPDFVDEPARHVAPPRPRMPVIRRRRPLRWAVVAIGIVAITEAGFIGRWLLTGSTPRLPFWESVSRSPVATPAASPSRPNVDPVVKDQPRLTPPPGDGAPTSLAPALTTAPANSKIAPEVRATEENAGKPPTVVIPTAPSVRSGGFRVSAPIQLHVLEGERLLGSSTDGPIITSAGQHEFEFVNSTLGYRTRRLVNVRAGEIAPLPIAVPNGTLNINATPWAAVSIDGNSTGDTPLGNISIRPGEHEVVFRHPQLGERRQRVLVRPDAVTGVAVTFK